MRPLAVALCDLDRPIITGEAPVPPPVAIGHECVAEVVEVGEEVASFAPGDLVVVPFQISCGACDRCRAGLTGDCREVPPGSMYGFGAFGGDWGGLVSDLARVPVRRARCSCRVPDGVDARHARQRLRQPPRRVAHRRRPARGEPRRRRARGRRRRPQHRPLRGRLRDARSGAGEVAYVDTDPDRLALAERARRGGHRGARPQVQAPADHRQRDRDPRGPARGASLDRPRRRLHERRHLLRGDDADAAARDVHGRACAS